MTIICCAINYIISIVFVITNRYCLFLTYIMPWNKNLCKKNKLITWQCCIDLTSFDILRHQENQTQVGCLFLFYVFYVLSAMQIQFFIIAIAHGHGFLIFRQLFKVDYKDTGKTGSLWIKLRKIVHIIVIEFCHIICYNLYALSKIIAEIKCITSERFFHAGQYNGKLMLSRV